MNNDECITENQHQEADKVQCQTSYQFLQIKHLLEYTHSQLNFDSVSGLHIITPS